MVDEMNLALEMVSERQQRMLADAAARRRGARAVALARATRRAERAQRQLARSRREARRLGVELAAEQSS